MFAKMSSSVCKSAAPPPPPPPSVGRSLSLSLSHTHTHTAPSTDTLTGQLYTKDTRSCRSVVQFVLRCFCSGGLFSSRPAEFVVDRLSFKSAGEKVLILSVFASLILSPAILGVTARCARTPNPPHTSLRVWGGGGGGMKRRGKCEFLAVCVWVRVVVLGLPLWRQAY